MDREEEMECSQSQPVTATACAATSGSEPSAAFTPGPWIALIDYNGVYAVRASAVDTLARLYHPPNGTAEANARLIAAAPELYEAVRAWAAHLSVIDNGVAGDGAKTGVEFGLVRDMLRDFRAALSKAEGRS